MNQIVFRNSDWAMLNDHLSKRKDVESAAYAIFKTSKRNDAIRFLVTQLVMPSSDDYLRRTAGRVSFTPEFSEKAFQRCEHTGGHLLDIHNHPWSEEVHFSTVDDHEATHTKVPYLTKYLPQTMICFIVFGASQAIAQARFWNKKKSRLSEVDRIVII